MAMKFNTHVAVFFPDNETGDVYTKFVTGTERSIARWEAGKPAVTFSEPVARDIVYGLTLNGFRAAVIKVPGGVELRN